MKRSKLVLLALAIICVSALVASAITNTSHITGVVTDPSGAVIPGAKVTASNEATGLHYAVETSSGGSYDITNLPLGTYKVTIEVQGFRTAVHENVLVRLGVPTRVDSQLEVGAVGETVVVSEATAKVETTSIELGGTVNSQLLTGLPSVGRNYTGFVFLMPGTQSSSDRFGTPSVSGQRTQANNFLIEGVDNNELALNTPLALPSPDSLEEFRLISNSMNAEYSRNSGSIINAVAKSGTNEFHGNLFYFWRHKGLNTNDFFRNLAGLGKSDFKRHLWGATAGGPVIKNRAFFFFSYQGTNQGTPQTLASAQRVYNAAERDADGNGFMDWSAVCPRANVPNVTAGCWTRGIDTNKDGVADVVDPNFFVSATPYFDSNGVLQPAFTSMSALWPNGLIPTTNIDPIALSILNGISSLGIPAIPLPNSPGNTWIQAFTQPLKNYQWSTKGDYNWAAGHRLSGYFFWQNQITNRVIPFTGATVPGFGDKSPAEVRRATINYTHVISPRILNEFRAGWNRLNFKAVQPTNIFDPQSIGFTGIIVQNPTVASGPNFINAQGWFDWGFSRNGPQPRISEVFQFFDSVSWVKGNHSFKFGGEVRGNAIKNPFLFAHNGVYQCNGNGLFPALGLPVTESTGIAGLDLLLGNCEVFFQSSGANNDARSKSLYVFGQDQWRFRPNLTITFGLGYTIEQPWRQLFGEGQLQNAFRVGVQSQVFTSAPRGLLYPDDPGIGRGTYPTRKKNFGPRAGFAWSPGSDSKWITWLTGGAGKSSLRMGYGIFYNFIEEEPNLQFLLTPPIALFKVTIFPTLPDPYVDRTGLIGDTANPFPFIAPAVGSAPSFDDFFPINTAVINGDTRLPYAQNWNVTVERELPWNSIFRLSYVGSKGTALYTTGEILDLQGRALLHEADPATFPLTSTGGSFCGASTASSCLPFQSLGEERSDVNSIYHSLQAGWEKRYSNGLTVLSSYTWSHAIDDGSGFEDTSNTPFQRFNDRGDSEFDARHRLVSSFLWDIPGPKTGVGQRVIGGWSISGIVTFATGFPVTIFEGSRSCDPVIPNSFFGTWCRPNVTGPTVQSDPREAAQQRFFQTSTFTDPSGFTNGNAGRNWFHGPGTNNYDLAVLKRINVDETRWIQLRFEFFNAWNHTQFNNPNGDQDDSRFGRITSVSDHLIQGANRVIQLSLKVYF